RTIGKVRHASRRSYRNCNDWVGPKAVIYKSNIAGGQTTSAKLQQNWLRFLRTSSLSTPPKLRPQCNRQQKQCRLYSRKSPILSARALLPVLRGPPAILLDSRISATILGQNGWKWLMILLRSSL